MTITIDALEIDSPSIVKRSGGVVFSIGTLVRNHAQYVEMKNSFTCKGFCEGDCEFIYIDNSIENKMTSYRGLNHILNAAYGKYVILCHQDIRLHSDDRHALETRLAELDGLDPNWALAGNAGGVEIDKLAVRISDPTGENRRSGTFPARVSSLDENFIVVRRQSRVSFSNDLDGFHFYGADICLNADMLGYSSYVIDFHLRHLSGGKLDQTFIESQRRFEQKWCHALRQRSIQTTCAAAYLKGSL